VVSKAAVPAPDFPQFQRNQMQDNTNPETQRSRFDRNVEFAQPWSFDPIVDL